MLKKKLAICLISLVSIYAYANEKVTLVCPASADLVRTTINSSWATYRYTGYSNVAIPELGNRIQLMGDTNASIPGDFYAATWTDQTFLCLYNLNDTLVIYETVLYLYVDRCYFENSLIPSRTECKASDPGLCPLTCELNK